MKKTGQPGHELTRQTASVINSQWNTVDDVSTVVENPILITDHFTSSSYRIFTNNVIPTERATSAQENSDMAPSIGDIHKKQPTSFEEGLNSIQVVIDILKEERSVDSGDTTTLKTRSVSTPASSSSSNSFDNNSVQKDVELTTTDVENQIVIKSSTGMSSCIINGYQLGLMSQLPEEPAYSLFYKTTVVTQEGLHQYNSELKKFKCYIPAGELVFYKPFNELMVQAAEVPVGEFVSIYDELTREQLTRVHYAVQERQGFTLLGYPLNLEIFVRSGNLGVCSFPPPQNNHMRRFMAFLEKPVVKDVTVSLRGAVQTYILFDFLLYAIVELNKKSQEVGYTLTIDYAADIFYVMLGITACELILLRGNCVNKEKVLSKIARVCLIESATIGIAKNWLTYATLFLPEDIAAYGFVFALAYGFRKGCKSQKGLFLSSSINIAKRPKWHTSWNSLSNALNNGALCALGLISPVNSLFFFKADMSDPKELARFKNTMAYIQYSIGAFALMIYLTRFPNNSSMLKNTGRYATNILNGISYSFLDNAALFALIDLSTTAFFGNSPKPNVGINTYYFGFQALFFIYAFVTTFSTMPNLPELSTIENVETEQSILDRVLVSYNKVKEYGLRFFERPSSSSNLNPDGIQMLSLKKTGDFPCA